MAIKSEFTSTQPDDVSVRNPVDTSVTVPQITLSPPGRSTSGESPNGDATSGEGSLGETSYPRESKYRFLPWRWLFVGFNICVVAGAAAVGSFLWIIALPPTPDCQKLTAMSPDGERLYCAQRAAQSGTADGLLLALELVEPWGLNHPLYAQKQQQLEQWSEDILKLAHQQASDSNLEDAVALAQHVPPSSVTYDKAQETIKAWRTEWQRGEAIYGDVQTALQNQDWDVAFAQAKELTDFSHPYWRSHQAQTLFQQIVVEQKAYQVATQAYKLAAKDTSQDLQKAIATARTLDPSTYSWAAIQPNITAWNQALLDEGLALWQAGKLTQAISLADVVATHPPLKSAAHDLIMLSKARRRAIASTSNWEPTVAHLWHLNQALAIAHDIPSDSPFHSQAAASIASWTKQLEDLRQLHYAQMAANFATKEGYQFAIQQADEIENTRPRRLQAQTLIAHWQDEIERIEDRPLLNRARQLAASGVTEDIRNAIARAQKIAPGRALYDEAQSLIWDWQAELQTRADRPILNRAQRLADEGNLQEAISTASEIRQGRSLYREAQRLIERWRSELHKSQAPEEENPALIQEMPPGQAPRPRELPLNHSPWVLPHPSIPVVPRYQNRGGWGMDDFISPADAQRDTSDDLPRSLTEENSTDPQDGHMESQESFTPNSTNPMQDQPPTSSPAENRGNEQSFEPGASSNTLTSPQNRTMPQTSDPLSSDDDTNYVLLDGVPITEHSGNTREVSSRVQSTEDPAEADLTSMAPPDSPPGNTPEAMAEGRSPEGPPPEGQPMAEAQTFDVHAELTDDPFPLLFAGSLYAGI